MPVMPSRTALAAALALALAAPAAFSATRVVVTAHSNTGEAVFESDATASPYYPFGPQATGFTRFHSRISVPVNNQTSPPDLGTSAPPKCPPQGVLFCTSDFPPNFVSPMHRTVTLDYGVVMSGEIVLRLDSGEERTVRAGEVIVQKGVNHQWINRGPETCRMICFMAGAEKIRLDNGTVLEEAFQRP